MTVFLGLALLLIGLMFLARKRLQPQVALGAKKDSN